MTTMVPAPDLGGRRSWVSRVSPFLGSWFLPVVAAIVIFVVMASLRPAVASPLGITLVFAPLIPLIFAALAQMFVVAGGDIDLGIGAFISLVNVVFATAVASNPVLGIAVLIVLVAAYAAMGVLISIRRLPSIIVTLGMSFVWLGIAIVILPTPGGAVPKPIVDFARWNNPVVPMVAIVIVVVAVLVTLFLTRTRYGAVLRGAGSNPEGVRRAGWSTTVAKVTLYALAGLFGVLSGLYLSGQNGGGDPHIAQSFVLLSIAGVVVGGGTFNGGEISPVGTIAGALVVGMLGSLLQFLNVPSQYQVGAQGLVLVLVLVLRSVAGWIQKSRRTR